DDAFRADDDTHPLGTGALQVRLHLVGPVADVALEDAAADGHRPLVVGHDLGPADDLDALQLLVALPRLDQAGDLRVALQVADLLRLAVGPERRVVPDEPVPHRHEVDRAVVVHRRPVPAVPPGDARPPPVVGPAALI